MAIAWSKSSRQPGTPMRNRAAPRHARAVASGDPMIILPFAGSSTGEIDNGLGPSQTLPSISPVSMLGNDTPRTTARSSTPGRRSIPPTPCISEASREASRTRPCSTCSTVIPAIPTASDALSSAWVHRSRSSSNRDEMSGWNRFQRVAAYQRPRSDAHRHSIRSRRRAARRRPASARSQLSCAAAMSRLDRPAARPHVPLVCGGQVACSLEVLGDQCGVLVVLFDRRGHALMQLRAIGFQL